MSNLPTSSGSDQQLVVQVLGGNTLAFGQVVQCLEGLVTRPFCTYTVDGEYLTYKCWLRPGPQDSASDRYPDVGKRMSAVKYSYSPYPGSFSKCMIAESSSAKQKPSKPAVASALKFR